MAIRGKQAGGTGEVSEVSSVSHLSSVDVHGIADSA